MGSLFMGIAISLKKPDAKPSREQPKRFSQAAQENSNKEYTSIHMVISQNRGTPI